MRQSVGGQQNRQKISNTGTMIYLDNVKLKILFLGLCFCRLFRSARPNHPAKTFRRQKDGGQKNSCRLLHPVIVNFPGMMPDAIFLSFIFLSWLLFKLT